MTDSSSDSFGIGGLWENNSEDEVLFYEGSGNPQPITEEQQEQEMPNLPDDEEA